MPQFRSRQAVAAAIAVAFLVGTQAAAGTIKSAEKAIERGDYQRAYNMLLKKQDSAEASYLIGEMAIDGHLPSCDSQCTLDWLTKASNLGSIFALNQIGVFYWNQDQQEIAVSYFNQAARWNDPGAKDFLSQRGLVIPEPDLWILEVSRRNAVAQQKVQARLAAQAQAQQNLREAVLLGLLVAGSVGSTRPTTGPANGYGVHGSADLVGQLSNGSQRQCVYNTPSGNVTVIVAPSESCPQAYVF